MPSQTPDTVLALLTLPIPDFVQKAYLILLGRQPESHEIAARATVLRTGWGRVRLLENIVSSEEFTNREQKLLGDGSPRAFVERNYLLYLNRTPDVHGLEHYTKMLDAGRTRDAVRRDIAGSKEALATGSFWVELERLLADERKNMRRFGRWFGLFRRQERRWNLEMEVLRLQSEANIRLAGAAIERLGGTVQQGALIGRNAAHVPGVQDNVDDVDMSMLPPGARRMLSRLRHFHPKIRSSTLSIEGTF